MKNILPTKRWILAIVTLVCIVTVITALTITLHRDVPLPYHDAFANNKAGEWVPLGGAWEVNNGIVYNRSDERGAKLVSGSPDWGNYQLDADLKLIGHEGNIGVVVRTGREQRGVDAYDGYFIGLRSQDSALLYGRNDNAWLEGQPVPMPGGVQIGVWYRLHVVAFECQIGAEATNLSTRQTAWIAFRDQGCFRKGKIALRSFATGGAWRNISVTPASDSAWQQISSHVNAIPKSEFIGLESDYSRIHDTYFKGIYSPISGYNNSADTDSIDRASSLDQSPIVNIDSVRMSSLEGKPVRIRGVVTLTRPLFIQDSSGSIEVENSQSAELNLGDEVEISGKTVAHGFTPEFLAANIRLLWDRTLVVPVSITSTQAASGAFDGSLIEVRGILKSKAVTSNKLITLQLYDSVQAFTAVVRGGLSMQSYENWVPGSSLSIRGICTLPASSSDTDSAFTMLLRATDDVQVLAGPPWWSGRQLIRLLLLTFLLVCCGVYLYLRLERWKMNTITDERERLAHDLHDTLAQSFAGIGFHLQGLYRGLHSGSTTRPQAITLLHEACNMVAHSHFEASACIAALHPDPGQEQDFLVTLDRSTREMLHSSNIAPIPLTLVREGLAQPLSMHVHDALFHIGREAIANMLHHAHATEMELKLRYEARGVVFEMRDNGVGFVSKPSSEGFGIRGMRYRCLKIGARMEIVSKQGEGTTIIVHAPYGLRPRLTEWVRSFLEHHHKSFAS